MKKKTTKNEFVPYWHKEIWIAIPLWIIWTVLLIGIYFNTK